MPERIAHAREPQKLPVVLSADEVVRFLEAVPSLKSRAALTTAYAAGLRASEAVSLKSLPLRRRGSPTSTAAGWSFASSRARACPCEGGGGGRDRYVMLSPPLLAILRSHWRLPRPGHWLFPGRDGEHPINPTVLHAACRSACAAAGLTKRVTVHTLRRSFATHLLESGTDIRIIQALLGHRNVNTTARHAHVATSTISGTPSPLDRLRLEVTPPS